MKAVWYNKFGPAQEVFQFGEWETPIPEHGEVLVRLYTSGVNPSDVKKRAGSNPALLKAGPVIPHSDGAGIIEAVGPGVPISRIGQRVWTYNAQFGRQLGTAAQFVSLDSDQAVWMPNNTSFEIGACMGIPAMTAHRCVFADGAVRGKTLLVTGGAGRVGHYAVQLAKLDGAQVIATASSGNSRQQCEEAGADLIIPHPNEYTADQVMEFTGGKGVDRIIESEFGGNLIYSLDALKTNGVMATYASTADPTPKIPFYKMMYKDLTLRLVIVYAMPVQAKMKAASDITNLLERNQLKHRVVHKIPLDNMWKAHEIIEKGEVKGCVVVDTT